MGKASRREAQDAPGGLGDPTGRAGRACGSAILARSPARRAICWSAARGKRRWRNALPPPSRRRRLPSLAAFPLARSGRAAVRAYCSPEPQDSRRTRPRASGWEHPAWTTAAAAFISSGSFSISCCTKGGSSTAGREQRRPEHQRHYGGRVDDEQSDQAYTLVTWILTNWLIVRARSATRARCSRRYHATR